MRRVGITGIGIVSPLGVGIDQFWNGLIEGRSPFRRISRFDASTYPCQVAGEVDDAIYEELIDPRKARTVTHATRLALAASELALRDARLPRDHYAPYASGVAVGTALGGWADAERQVGIMAERGARRANPFVLSGAGPHGPAVEVAAAIGAQGANAAFASGCPASLQAIGHGVTLVSSGALDVCIAGGTESPLSPTTFASLCRTQELSPEIDDPTQASRPFDEQHSGIVLSEGSCFLVLEAIDSAVERGAKIYAEVSDAVSSCDAKGLYHFDPSGEAGARAIFGLLQRHGVGATEIDYVCAHANSAPRFDHKETLVLKLAFGECAARLPVSSIKAILGHPFGASGAFQVAASALGICRGTIPPTHNLKKPAAGCDLDYVPSVPRNIAIRNAIVTSYGYGGINSYLLVKRV